MCRTAVLVVVLAALATAGACGMQVSRPAKPHGRTPAAAGPHTAHGMAPARSTHRAAPILGHRRAERKSTPEEVGFRAGLAIRRQLAERQAVRRSAVLRVERSRVTPSPRVPPEPAQRADADDGSEETAVADRPALPDPAPESDGYAAPTESGEDAESNARPPAERAVATRDANAGAETEEASLRIPMGAMPPLRGTLASLERQNMRLDAEGLERIEDEADLASRIAHGFLVPVPASSALTVNADLPLNHRYCRAWTARFLTDLARGHEAQFHRPLEVSSAVRTVEYQKRLMEINGNAAPAEGDIVSPHLTGATIDIAKDGMSRKEIAWMRQRLLALEEEGKIDAEEEFKQACFHITVYKNYAPPRPASQEKAGRNHIRHHPAPAPDGAIAAQGI